MIANIDAKAGTHKSGPSAVGCCAQEVHLGAYLARPLVATLGDKTFSLLSGCRDRSGFADRL